MQMLLMLLKPFYIVKYFHESLALIGRQQRPASATAYK